MQSIQLENAETIQLMGRNAVGSKLLNAVKKGDPFSFIRVGDGEGRLLLWPSRIRPEIMDTHLRFWFGHHRFSNQEKMKLKGDLILSMREADIIGVPWKQIHSFFVLAREITAEIRGTTWDGFGTSDLHIKMWRGGQLQETIHASKKVVLISCRDVLLPFKARFQIPTTWLEIPEEGRTGRRPTNHYPLVYDRILDEIELMGPGFLYLIGGGVLGKSYCRAASDAGNVAIDIGSIFDLWAGVISRSFMGLNSLREEFKL